MPDQPHLLAAETDYPRDFLGYGPTPPDPRWPGGAKLALSFVLNYEEGGENTVLNGDAGSELYLHEVPGGSPVLGERNRTVESQFDYGARAGVWRDRAVLPSGWTRELSTPTPLNAQYGLLWWTGGGDPPRFASAPRDSVFALGGGDHIIWIAPSLDLVTVIRWIHRPHADAFMGRIIAAQTG